MTNKDLKIVIVVLACCLAAVLVSAIVFGILYFATRSRDDDATDFSNLTYLALGDSITYGYDSARNGLAMDNPYCKVVEKLLVLKNSINEGISGSTVAAGFLRAEMCERYKTMPDNADIVSVMGGVNDYAVGVPLGKADDTDTTTFYGALNALASGLKAKYPNAFIFFMTPLKFRDCENAVGLSGAMLKDYRKAVKDVCAKYDIPVLDTNELADYSKEYNTPGYTGDGLHPSQEFMLKTLGPLIAQFIRDNLTDISTN